MNFSGTPNNDTFIGTTGQDQFDLGFGGLDYIVGDNLSYYLDNPLDHDGVFDAAAVDYSTVAGKVSVGIWHDPLTPYGHGNVFSPTPTLHKVRFEKFESISVVSGAGDDNFAYTIYDTAAVANPMLVDFDAGAGTDVLLFANTGTDFDFTFNAASGVTHLGTVTFANFELFYVKSGSGLNIITTGAGRDQLHAGVDRPNAVDSDVLTGGAGDDGYFVGNSLDQTIELAGGGVDTVYASISWTLAAEVERLTLSSALATQTVNGTGNELGNKILGHAGVNTLLGLEGDDHLDGLGGADTLLGGLGNDKYYVDQAGDVINEEVGAGTDSVFASFGLTLPTDVENLTLLDSAGAAGAQGNALNNVLTGNASANALIGLVGADTLNGKVGADTMSGGLGADNYYVDNTLDLIIETSGTEIDKVFSSVNYVLGANVEYLTLQGTAMRGEGNSLANRITGNASNNILLGGGGNDVLSGSAGNDHIDGGSGKDTLTGGTGVDHFVLSAANLAAADTIADFVHLTDKLMVVGADFGLAAGVLPASALVLGSSALGGSAQFVFDSVSRKLSWDADGLAGGEHHVATLTNVTVLSAGDFVIA